MDVEEITDKEYSSIFNSSYNVFISAPFNELNKAKCERLLYLLFHEGRVKLGLIAGIKENKCLSPFSAPYGGFSTYNNRIKLKYINDSIILLDKYLKSQEINEIVLVLPPWFYNESFLSKVCYSLLHNNYKLLCTDLNFHFNIGGLNDYQNELIGKRTKEKLKKTVSAGLTFKQVTDENDKLTAYTIVKSNRELKNRPLHMTFEQLTETTKVINADYFLIYLENLPIASAIVYHVAPGIVQLIFWGDKHEYSQSMPMNFLSFKLFEYYSDKNINVIDLGISTENGIPNYGLCDFKQSIGGIAALKYTLTKNYS
jgi:hypothetical protein